MEKFDFSGWATKNDLKCSDGRTIRKDAFKDNDGQTVPLVWQHQHDDPANVLGHALLENREDGVYTYGAFNDTPKGRIAKELVNNGDITALSIYANQLKQQGGDVLHGAIKEVSLVLAGANPGAWIDFPVLAHGDGELEELYDEATIFTGETITLAHAESDEKKEDEDVADEKKEKKEKTVKDVFDSMTEEQKNVVYFMIGQALEDAGVEDDSDESDTKGDNEMKHNVFDSETRTSNVLSHDDFQKIMTDAKRLGSMKAAVEEHIESGVLAHDDLAGDVVFSNAAQNYFVDQPDFLFPEARALSNTPEWIRRDTSWVYDILNGAHHTPFSRIKSVFANLTEDEARAKGYLKGNQKKEQVFSLLKRSTTPQTVYKKQKMDRDDVIDITDFDSVAFVKGEMRGQLDEEIARAALIGDGRLSSDDDKIFPDHIRPVYNDADLFTIKVGLNITGTATEDDVAKTFIRKAIRARKNYRGSGSPRLYTTEDLLTMMLLLEDDIGHPLYADEAALARKLRVSKIVTVPVMEGFEDGNHGALWGIIMNPADYTFGADRGGAVSLFEDFDIDVNQMKYLIETRCSGCLTKPYSAIAIFSTYEDASDGTDVFYNAAHKDSGGQNEENGT